ncbi:hypothetical protein OUZ56_032146 [Daphnia magna]|uniref:Uncharacterized protein n=1 Tax=Daphnia magna TaxID=35525 RepID=A0ABQ9ZWD1_9CRUS|nr:hypothetical protein OUZ56_032146 [Daphnia magna]
MSRPVTLLEAILYALTGLTGQYSSLGRQGMVIDCSGPACWVFLGVSSINSESPFRKDINGKLMETNSDTLRREVKASKTAFLREMEGKIWITNNFMELSQPRSPLMIFPLRVTQQGILGQMLNGLSKDFHPIEDNNSLISQGRFVCRVRSGTTSGHKKGDQRVRKSLPTEISPDNFQGASWDVFCLSLTPEDWLTAGGDKERRRPSLEGLRTMVGPAIQDKP